MNTGGAPSVGEPPLTQVPPVQGGQFGPPPPPGRCPVCGLYRSLAGEALCRPCKVLASLRHLLFGGTLLQAPEDEDYCGIVLSKAYLKILKRVQQKALHLEEVRDKSRSAKDESGKRRKKHRVSSSISPNPGGKRSRDPEERGVSQKREGDKGGKEKKSREEQGRASLPVVVKEEVTDEEEQEEEEETREELEEASRPPLVRRRSAPPPEPEHPPPGAGGRWGQAYRSRRDAEQVDWEWRRSHKGYTNKGRKKRERQRRLESQRQEE